MRITVKAFGHGSAIPRRHTCDGEDVSPEIVIDDVPSGAKSLALIMDDPDAPMGLFTHWIAFNIPANSKVIREGAGNDGSLEQGVNDFGRSGYGGPCPPPGKPHRYYFTLYALSADRIDASGGRAVIDRALKGITIEKASYMGTYGRTR